MPMTNYLLVAALVLSVSAHAFELKTVFTIPLPLPPSNTEFFTAGAGNTYYTVGEGGELMAVDLVSKKVVWRREFADDAIIGLSGFTSPNGGPDVLLVSLSGATLALNNNSALLWVSAALDFSLSTAAPNTYTVNNGTLYFFATNADGFSAFTALNLLTGEVVLSLQCESAIIYPNEAILTNNTGSETNEVTAYAIPTLNQLWSLAIYAFIAQNNDYLVVAIRPSSDSGTEVLVLNPKTLAPISHIDGVSGIVSDGFAEIINQHFLLAKIGFNSEYAYFDLRNGRMVWELGGSGSGSSSGGTVPAAAGVTGALATNNSILFLDGLKLHFISIDTGRIMATHGYVPVTQAGTISQGLGPVASVLNLQGYTSWDTTTGELVGRNERDPTGTTALPSTYFWMNKYYVSTVGSTVIGQVVVP